VRLESLFVAVGSGKTGAGVCRHKLRILPGRQSHTGPPAAPFSSAGSRVADGRHIDSWRDTQWQS
jgi:hypothetical protein